MKTLLTILTLSLVTSTSYAQTKKAPAQSSKKPVASTAKPTQNLIISPSKIRGIGKFRIRETSLSIIDSLEKELGVELVKVNSTMEMLGYEDKKAVLELIPDLSADYPEPAYASLCKDAQVFYLPTYTISDIEIHELKLKFYKGKLIDIGCKYSSELEDALETKYGKGVLKRTSKPVTCVYKLTGNKVVNYEETFTTTWQNGPIKASILLWKNYDQNCKEGITSLFSINDATMLPKIVACEEAGEIAKDAALKAAIKKKLSDF